MAFWPFGFRKAEISEDDSEVTVLCVCSCVIGKTVEDGVWLMRDGVKAPRQRTGDVVWRLSVVNMWGRRLGVSTAVTTSWGLPMCHNLM